MRITGLVMLSSANQVEFTLVALLSLMNSTPLTVETVSILCSSVSKFITASRIFSFRIPITDAATHAAIVLYWFCLLYTSDAADERSSVDLGGRRIIKKK